MKLIRTITLNVCCLAAVVASAQFRFGLKVETSWNNLTIKEDVDFKTRSRMGFNAGPMVEWNFDRNAVIDASLLYCHRSVEVQDALVTDENGKLVTDDKSNFRRDYLELPINIKYKFNIPAFGGKVTPFVMSGPSVSFLLKNTDENNDYSKVVLSWTAGLGVELWNHFQISAHYSKGLTNSFKDIVYTAATSSGGDITSFKTNPITAKDYNWTVSAAYIF